MQELQASFGGGFPSGPANVLLQGGFEDGERDVGKGEVVALVWVVGGRGGGGGGGRVRREGGHVGAEEEPCGFGAGEDDFFFPPLRFLLLLPLLLLLLLLLLVLRVERRRALCRCLGVGGCVCVPCPIECALCVARKGKDFLAVLHCCCTFENVKGVFASHSC